MKRILKVVFFAKETWVCVIKPTCYKTHFTFSQVSTQLPRVRQACLPSIAWPCSARRLPPLQGEPPCPLGALPSALRLPAHSWIYKPLGSAASLPQRHCHGTLGGSPCLLIPPQGCPWQISTRRTDCRQHILGLILWTSGKTATDVRPLCVLPVVL